MGVAGSDTIDGEDRHDERSSQYEESVAGPRERTFELLKE